MNSIVCMSCSCNVGLQVFNFRNNETLLCTFLRVCKVYSFRPYPKDEVIMVFSFLLKDTSVKTGTPTHTLLIRNARVCETTFCT